MCLLVVYHMALRDKGETAEYFLYTSDFRMMQYCMHGFVASDTTFINAEVTVEDSLYTGRQKVSTRV